MQPYQLNTIILLLDRHPYPVALKHIQTLFTISPIKAKKLIDAVLIVGRHNLTK